MKVLGITGGVGAGKSTVLNYMHDRYGAHIIECDEVGRQLQQKGEPCFEPVVRLFGPECVGSDGQLNRSRISKKVFSDQTLLKRLDEIIHPAVMERVKEMVVQDRVAGDVPFAVVESAILLEAGYRQVCDEIWFVSVPYEQRAARLRQQRGYSEEKIAAVLSRQKSDEQLAAECDFRIDNGAEGIENTYGQIDRALAARGFISGHGLNN